MLRADSQSSYQEGFINRSREQGSLQRFTSWPEDAGVRAGLLPCHASVSGREDLRIFDSLRFWFFVLGCSPALKSLAIGTFPSVWRISIIPSVASANAKNGKAHQPRRQELPVRFFANGVTWDRPLQEDLSEKSSVALDNLDALTSFSSAFPFFSFNFFSFSLSFLFPLHFLCLSLSCICVSDVYAQENLRLRVDVRGQFIGVGSLLPPCGAGIKLRSSRLAGTPLPLDHLTIPSTQCLLTA